MLRRILWSLFVASIGFSAALGADSFDIEGPVNERTVTSSTKAFTELMEQPGTHWVGWLVDSVSSKVHHGSCVLHLGGGQQSWTGDSGQDNAESPEVFVFLEVQDGKVRTVNTAETGCRIDARGVELEMWRGVSTQASYELLDQRILRHENPHLREEGLAAIARHRLVRVDSRLEQFARNDVDEEVRHGAIFWLGAVRGAGGYSALRRLEDHLSPHDLEEALVFGYYVSQEAEATKRLFHLAREHKISGVRSQALFWVAQEAGEAAISTLEAAVEHDPESEVREQAVFGLSQLPKDQAVPALIRVARTHRDPNVREMAFFWLGQTEDPRAMELFEEVLGVR